MAFLVKTLLRIAVFAMVFVAGLVIIDASDTTDPLGPGLLLFLVYVVLAFGWGTVDGRGRAKQALLVWLLVSVGVGLVLSLSTVLIEGTEVADADVVGTSVFTMVLVYPPALVGIGLGALVGRSRS